MPDRLRDLRASLTRLHKTLLEEERSAYESVHGPVASGPEMLRLLLQAEEFAWLRSLSRMISAIDEALDEMEDGMGDAQTKRFLSQAQTLLRSGGDSPFETKYRDALQRSPDVVMAHAAVVKLL